MSKYSRAFTLIELLIVVAIIAILAAIAIPNFLNAQTRAKVSRVKGDFSSIASAAESYAVDNNTYPPGYKTADSYGLDALSSPIAYISSGSLIDPFQDPDIVLAKKLYTYELMNVDNRLIENSTGTYIANPANESVSPCWWWVGSRGPDQSFGFKSFQTTEYNVAQRIYEAPVNPESLRDVIYDPTNGTISTGNIFRCGGEAPGVFAGIMR